MTDVIIELIRSGAINRNIISFDLLRVVSGRDYNRWAELGRGRAILSSYEQLDQYLYSYGPMIRSQWENFLQQVRLPGGNYHLTDYGCGQGLGCALLFDYFGARHAKQVWLIEPSSVAIQRAKAVVDCYLGENRSIALNIRLDDLSPADVRTSGEYAHVHIMSNILDIDDFNHGILFSKILQTPGYHTVLAVSHDRDHHGGSLRFENLEAAIKSPEHAKWISIVESRISRFNCENRQPAISWELHVEVLSGSI